MKPRTLIGAGHAVKRARRDGDDPLSLESGDFSRPSHVIVRSEAETVVISLSPGENGSRASQTDGELGPAFNFDGACHEQKRERDFSEKMRTHFINKKRKHLTYIYNITEKGFALDN